MVHTTKLVTAKCVQCRPVLLGNLYISKTTVLNISVTGCTICCISHDFIRVKLIIEEMERDEAALQDDLYSADRKFAEYYNV